MKNKNKKLINCEKQDELFEDRETFGEMEQQNSDIDDYEE